MADAENGRPLWQDVLSEKIVTLKESLDSHKKDDKDRWSDLKRCKEGTELRLRELENHALRCATRHKNED